MRPRSRLSLLRSSRSGSSGMRNDRKAGGVLAGSYRARNSARDRATALIEDIWCLKIRGCSYRGGNTPA